MAVDESEGGYHLPEDVPCCALAELLSLVDQPE